VEEELKTISRNISGVPYYVVGAVYSVKFQPVFNSFIMIKK